MTARDVQHRISELLDERGWSQTHLAKIVGVPTSTITDTPVTWKCAFGHEFKMSVNAVLHGGHWCPECLKKSWNYPAIARKNPFYAQVWDCQHSKDETYEIPMKYSAYDITNELKNKLGL